jgi:hypothetical protein
VNKLLLVAEIPPTAATWILTVSLLAPMACSEVGKGNGDRTVRAHVLERGTPTEVRVGQSDSSRLDPEAVARILRNADHSNNPVLWKTVTPVFVRFHDGSELKIEISNYGRFFSVDGWQGYFTCSDSDIRVWADLGLPPNTHQMAAPVFEVWDSESDS